MNKWRAVVLHFPKLGEDQHKNYYYKMGSLLLLCGLIVVASKYLIRYIFLQSVVLYFWILYNILALKQYLAIKFMTA